MPIPTLTVEQLELLDQLRERADDREHAYAIIIQEVQNIMRMVGRVSSLQLGDIPHSSPLIPAVMRALETQMIRLLEVVAELSVEAQMDEWTRRWIFDTIVELDGSPERVAQFSHSKHKSVDTEDRVHHWYGAVQNFRRSVSRLAEEGSLDSNVVQQECARLIERFPREILPATH